METLSLTPHGLHEHVASSQPGCELLPAPWGLRLWRVDLTVSPGAAALASLAADERGRASRFMFENHRRRYLHAHAALRALLAAHTGMPASHLSMREGPFGKPHVEGLSCSFNMSHSGDVALIAIADGVHEIGVDVEIVRSISDAPALARQCFTAAEYEEWAAATPDSREHAFLALWTRKEACLKALGTGLSVAPDSFHCGYVNPGGGVRVATPQGHVGVQLESIDCGLQQVAAVARVV